eukprot:jgi/Chlat1/7422/Chrsp6S07446
MGGEAAGCGTGGAQDYRRPHRVPRQRHSSSQALHHAPALQPLGYGHGHILATDERAPAWMRSNLDMQSMASHLTTGCLPYRPVMNSRGFVVHESSACAENLVQKGLHQDNIYKEWASYDTVANAYFALVQHAMPAGWSRLHVITSRFHMPRTRLLFEWVFGLQGAYLPELVRVRQKVAAKAGALLTVQQTQNALLNGEDVVGDSGYHLFFEATPDDAFSAVGTDAVQARAKREQESIAMARRNAQRIRTLPEFHRWFHTEHKAYNVANQSEFGKRSDIDSKALETY